MFRAPKEKPNFTIKTTHPTDSKAFIGPAKIGRINGHDLKEELELKKVIDGLPTGPLNNRPVYMIV